MEEDQKVIARKWLSWKRILPLVIIVSVLAAAVLYYVLPSVLFPLRRDSIPYGAYVVPWMKPNPNFGQIPFTFNMDTVMADALRLNMTFRIDMWNGTTRVIPSTVYLGHDSKYLYIGGRFIGMYSNPASVLGDLQPNRFQIYFDVAHDGVLKTPEAGSLFAVAIDVPPNEDLVSGQWDDMVWAYDKDTYKHMMWMPAYNYLLPDARLAGSSVAAQTAEYDNATGTVTILYARRLSTPGAEYFNQLQMRPGERWVMGFLIELEYQKELDNRVDGWPQTTFGVWSADSSWWPKLAIDLANPPESFVG